MRVLFVTVATLVSACICARADTFNFSFSGPDDSGSGVLTAGYTGTGDQYLISAISGTSDGLAITSLLAPGSYPSEYPPENDNLLLYPGTGNFLDEAGVAYELSDGSDVNLFYGPYITGTGTPILQYLLIAGPFQTLSEVSSFTVTAVTPEPSGFFLLGTGLLSIAGAVRKRF